MRRAVAAVFALALVTAAPSRGGDDDDEAEFSQPASGATRAFAKDLDRTWRQQGPEAFVALAREFRTDPFLVVGGLLRLVRARTDAPAPGDRDMLAAYARSLDGTESAAGVAALVTSWCAAGPEEHEREDRLKSALESARRAQNARHPEEVVEIAVTAARDLPAPISIAAPLLRLRLGRSLLALGRLAEARESAEVLRGEGRARGWPALESEALMQMVAVSLRRERFSEAAPHLREAARLRDGVSSRRLYVETLRDLARVELALSCVEEAAASAERARAISVSHGWASIELQCRCLLAHCAALTHRPEEALALCDAVVQTAVGRRFLDARLEAIALSVRLRADQGRLAAALDLGEDALRHASAAGKVGVRSTLHANVGLVCARLSLWDAAAEHLRASLALVDDEGQGPARAAVLGRLAVVEVARGDDVRALECLDAARAICSEVGDPRRSSATAAELARFHARRGAAQAAMRWSETALAEALASGRSRAVADARLARGAALLAAKRPDEAVEEIERALAEASSPEAGSALLAAECRMRLGRLLASRGRPVEAVTHLRAAVTNLADSADELGELDALGLVERARALTALGTQCAHASVAAGADAKDAVRTAWWFEEAARARLLAGSIVNETVLRRRFVPQPILDFEDRARAEADREREALAEAAARTPRDPARVAEASRRVTEAQDRLDRAAARTDREAHRAAPLVRPEVVSLDAFRSSLEPDSVCLTYSTAGAQSFVLAVTREGGSLVSLGESARLRELVRAMLDLASTPGGPDERVAARLGERLLGPVETLCAGKRRLIVVPDGELAYLPFEALILRRGDRGERVIERHEVVYAPSATVFGLLTCEAAARPAARGLLVLGDPVYDEAAPDPLPPATSRGSARSLARLVGSGAEVHAIASVYPEEDRTVLVREDATLERFLARAASSEAPLRAIHAACHAFVDPERPRLSGLVFSGGDVLNVETLYRSRLATDLAVLSACETAGGTALEGEGVIGLARGFMVAGALRVVVSGWRVSDSSTVRLMKAFHERLVRGEPPATALRGAKLEFLRSPGATSHPYHWAPFMLWGAP